jgi:RNA polymerase sigma-70 factor (ECF subfamily)
VYSIGLRMLNRRAEAEDLAQDVFLQLYRKLDSMESMEHVGFWLRRVAAYHAIDWLRRRPYTTAQPLDEGAEVAAPAG